MAEKTFNRDQYLKELPEIVKNMDGFRQGSNKSLPVDIHLGDMLQEKYGITQEDYFKAVGFNPKVDTMENIYSMPNPELRWLVPEIVREAIYLGMREAPFYPNIIASDQPINGLTAIMPLVNMSDANPARVNEAETIPLGTVSFGQKSVNLFKIG